MQSRPSTTYQGDWKNKKRNVIGETMEEEQPSSIGKLNKPFYDADNKRVKAFYTNSIESESQLEEMINDLRGMKEQHDADRITARFIVNDNVKREEGIEARIPLSNGLGNYSLIYFGENTPQRQSAEEILTQEKTYVNTIKDKPTVGIEEALRRPEQTGYTVEILENPSQKDLKDIIDVYSSSFDSYTYELNPENVEWLVTNPDNVVAVARDKNGIVSIGVAETGETPLCIEGEGERTFKFSELSDAATHPDHRAKGLYTATSVLLHKELTERGFDLVYGEARACNYGVNKSCQKIGREYFGTLEKHCVISGHKDIPEQGEYENLNVWGMNNEQLQEHFG